MTKMYRIVITAAFLQVGFVVVAAAQEQTQTDLTPADTAAPVVQPAPDSTYPAPPPPAQEPAPVDDAPAKTGVTTKDVVGKIGIGYFTTSAPVGLRMWVTDQIGFDVGVGFAFESESESWDFGGEAGLLYALSKWDNAIIFARGGLGVRAENAGETPDGEDSDTDVFVNINGMLGGELFMTGLGLPSLSFTGGLGLNLDIGDEFSIATQSNGLSIVNANALVGFHLYFN